MNKLNYQLMIPQKAGSANPDQVPEIKRSAAQPV